jgi:hypothetical protein
MSQWYYSKNNQQQGPVSPEQLKQLAVSGQLQPSDLVWKEGMGQWVEGRKIKGLFPAAPPANNLVPPPLPTAPNIPPVPTSATTNAQASSSDQPTAAPALWNPFAARAWTLVFTPIFGAFLHARNWEALGEMKSAKRSMIWFYSFLALVVIGIFSSQAATPILRLVDLVGLAGWCLIDAEKQIRFVKQRFGKNYPRKSWGKPVGIGVCGWLAAIVLAASVENSGISGGSGNPRSSLGVTVHTPGGDLLTN